MTCAVAYNGKLMLLRFCAGLCTWHLQCYGSVWLMILRYYILPVQMLTEQPTIPDVGGKVHKYIRVCRQ